MERGYLAIHAALQLNEAQFFHLQENVFASKAFWPTANLAGFSNQ